MKACQKHNVECLIQTSTPHVVIGERDWKSKKTFHVDETWTYATSTSNHYIKSKIMAEKLVLNANHPNKLKTMSIRPSNEKT